MNDELEFSEENDDIFLQYQQKMKNQKLLNRETFLTLINETLKELTSFSIGASSDRTFPPLAETNYAIIGGSAFNVYVKNEFKITTGDLDIKVFSVSSKEGGKLMFNKWISNFETILKHKLQDFNLSNIDIKDFTVSTADGETPVHQLLFNSNLGLGPVPILDIVYYPREIPVNIIDGLRYAKPSFLLSQLVEFKGFAAGAGLISKESRRLQREKVLSNSLNNVTIFDEKIHNKLCALCKNNIAQDESFTGFHIKCNKINENC